MSVYQPKLVSDMECKREVLSNISLYKGLGGKGDADECYHTGCYCGCVKRL